MPVSTPSSCGSQIWSKAGSCEYSAMNFLFIYQLALIVLNIHSPILPRQWMSLKIVFVLVLTLVALCKTISTSSLGSHFKENNCKCVVNAFHGYSHNWACQKVNHPNIVAGLGLEDLEMLERVFSASNTVAAVTQYITTFHRRVWINQFIQQ